MTADEIDKLLRESKASWQDEYGLRGPFPNTEPKTLSEPAPVEFEVKQTESQVKTYNPRSLRSLLDAIYDGEAQDGSSGVTLEVVYGAANGAPGKLTVLADGPWSAV